MKAISNKIVVRNLESESLTDLFLISAVGSILAIRGYLELTNYPQIGGGGLHIAHMLWGGLFMLISLFMFINFLSRYSKTVAVVLGGIGFGTFIDELGKFITSDNNYFFQPTIALIYILFILLYLISKQIPKLKPISQQEYLINALELFKEAIIDDLDEEEKDRALKYLKKSNQSDRIVKYLNELVASADAIKLIGVGRFTKIKVKIQQFYFNLIKKSWFLKLVFILFVFQIFDSLSNFGEFIWPLYKTGIIALAFPELMELFFSVMSTILIILGMIRLRFARVWSYQMFKIALLISIFLTQIFDFYRIELMGIFDLFIDLTCLGVISYMIDREKNLANSS